MNKKDEAMKLALEATLEALRFSLHVGFDESSESQIKKADKAVQQHQKAITALQEALRSVPDWASEAIEQPAPVTEPRKQEPDNSNYRLDPPGLDSLYTSPPAQRKPLTNEQAHQTLLDMAAHIEGFGNEDTTEEQMSGECIRFILERVTAHGIKE